MVHFGSGWSVSCSLKIKYNGLVKQIMCQLTQKRLPQIQKTCREVAVRIGLKSIRLVNTKSDKVDSNILDKLLSILSEWVFTDLMDFSPILTATSRHKFCSWVIFLCQSEQNLFNQILILYFKTTNEWRRTYVMD